MAFCSGLRAHARPSAVQPRTESRSSLNAIDVGRESNDVRLPQKGSDEFF